MGEIHFPDDDGTKLIRELRSQLEDARSDAEFSKSLYESARIECKRLRQLLCSYEPDGDWQDGQFEMRRHMSYADGSEWLGESRIYPRVYVSIFTPRLKDGDLGEKRYGKPGYVFLYQHQECATYAEAVHRAIMDGALGERNEEE